MCFMSPRGKIHTNKIYGFNIHTMSWARPRCLPAASVPQTKHTLCYGPTYSRISVLESLVQPLPSAVSEASEVFSTSLNPSVLFQQHAPAETSNLQLCNELLQSPESGTGDSQGSKETCPSAGGG